MVAEVVSYLIPICIGIAIVWGWVAFIAEAIARRRGVTSKVPYPDEGLWALFGKDLLDLGLFGGAPAQKQRHLQRRLKIGYNRRIASSLAANKPKEA